MTYIKRYSSPLGGILIAANGGRITGLWFDGAKYYAAGLPAEYIAADVPVLSEAVRWLDIYFSGKEPDFLPPLDITGSAFRREVCGMLLQIPYGTTVTYGDVAKELAIGRGASGMSAQAVGGAVGHNRISLMIPCHRVVGADGSLTGYAGGIGRKAWLLRLEQGGCSHDINRWIMHGNL